MYTSIISRIKLIRDIALALVTVLFGRILPKLKWPPANLAEKVAIVTGGNSGIGLEIALDMAGQGCTVYLACRNTSKAEAAVSRIISQVPASKGRVHYLMLDTSSLDSVRSFATDWKSLNLKIDFLFQNAGIGHSPAAQPISAYGFPTVYATNFLGQYDSAFSSDFSLRPVKNNLESGFHTAAVLKPQKGASQYHQTKAMQVVLTRMLQDRFDRQSAEAGTKVRRIVHAFSPGFVNSAFLDGLTKPKFLADPISWLIFSNISVFGVDASAGAATGIWLACTNDDAVTGAGRGGGYWERNSRRLSSVDSLSRDSVERFWVRWEADAGVEWR